MKIGVLAFQGDVIEHVEAIKKLGHTAVEVKKAEDLEDLQGIILPGGESTTMGRLLKVTNLLEPLKKKIEEGFPVWGTCAGMILLAKEIDNDNRRHLAVMDIKVRRNAFGRQSDSFEDETYIKEISNEPLKLVFIRAPYIVKAGENVEVLLKTQGKITAAKEKNIFVTSFHPELTNNSAVLEYFIKNIIKENIS